MMHRMFTNFRQAFTNFRQVLGRNPRAGTLAALLLIGVTYLWMQREIVPPVAREWKDLIGALKPLHRPLGFPRPGDWLAVHREWGQSFAQYTGCRPTLPTPERNILYVRPIGDFTEKQRAILAATTDFLGRFYGLETRTCEAIPLEAVPPRARRKHPSWGMDQLLSTYLMGECLAPALPDDAAALLGLTASDLWPGEGWNFVFGQASLHQRVGVWSMYRNGDLDKDDPQEYLRCLRRTLKVAVHETGHMFTIRHCTAYECGMCGSQHLEEADRRPIEFCPECVAKVCWGTGVDPAERFRRLADFCRTHGLDEEREFYEKSLRAVTDLRNRPAAPP